MNKELLLILCANLLILCGCSKAQQTLSTTIRPEVDLGASQQPMWTPTLKSPSTSTHTCSPTSTIIPTPTLALKPTITSTPSLTATPTILPPVLTWRNWSGKLTYETAEWIDYDFYSLVHRNIDGCRIEVIAGRGLPAGWSPSFDTHTIGGLTWDRVRWSHNGVLMLASFRIPLKDETGYSVWGGRSVYACMRAAEEVLATYQPKE